MFEVLNVSSFRQCGYFTVYHRHYIVVAWLIYVRAWLLKAFELVTPVDMLALFESLEKAC